jgi:heme exporter protein D
VRAIILANAIFSANGVAVFILVVVVVVVVAQERSRRELVCAAERRQRTGRRSRPVKQKL